MDSRHIIFFSIGNPGPITRHSVGHLMLKHILSFIPYTPGLIKKSIYSISSTDSITYLKSNSYMNESFKSWNKFKIDNKRLINAGPIIFIIYDDFEKNLGNIRISKFKKNESHNGLKGLKNVFNNDNNNNNNSNNDNIDVYLLGIGIGPKPQGANKETMSNWILSGFKMEEKMKLENETVELLELYIREIIELDGNIGDVNKFNSRLTKIWKSKQIDS
ncbi:predicted protein [Candida tropicalis MYA-3404]|uniref:Peptidyl-tRNA hydrolase n=1 Tax=Candida tropicalis (strain ATCC MYA-3404 / T1) TaxID=294747 RepID=C5M601_CANTT|nr:predicted protein [Candida tropicalis MYA-3404]EER34421.1 predicted protein [Candida tropicalis MYA-3404]KAG4408292.1 hypothetical protein JTP64_001598 [Candida tropicalis]